MQQAKGDVVCPFVTPLPRNQLFLLDGGCSQIPYMNRENKEKNIVSSLVTKCLFRKEYQISFFTSSEIEVLPQGGQTRHSTWRAPTHGPFCQACYLGNILQSQHLQNKWEFLPSDKFLPARLIFFKCENLSQPQFIWKGMLLSTVVFSRLFSLARLPLRFICCLPINWAKILEIFIYLKGIYCPCRKMKPRVIICSNILN